ncbi:MAG TPA: lipoyl(octanoyl) transferase LipB [Actinomycetota bacterium]
MTGRAWLLAPGRVPYSSALEAMRELVDRRIVGEVPDTLLLLEHEPVYTAGRRTDPSHLLMAERDLRARGAELHHVDRGGSVTFHGPGQLVGYPIVHLGVAPSLAQHVRRMQDVVIRSCADVGVRAAPDDEVGVWCGDRKVCAIGVKSTRRVTYHGFALNCTTDLSWFDAIVPCGLADRGVTTLSQVAGRTVTVEEMTSIVARHFSEVFDRELSPAPAEAAPALGRTVA